MVKKTARNGIRRSAAMLAVLLLCTVRLPVVRAETLAERLDPEGEYGMSFDYSVNGSYRQALSEYEEKGYRPADLKKPIVMQAHTFSAAEKQPTILDEYHGESQVALWEEDNGYMEWSVDLPAEGLYTIGFTYCACADATGDILRTISINGKVPYEEAVGVPLYRRFKPEGEPKTNGAGDQVRPGMTQLDGWQTDWAADKERIFTAPMQFHLNSGNNTIRLEYVEGAVVLKELLLYTAATIPEYKAYRAQNEQEGRSSANETIYLEAERDVSWVNDSTLRAAYDPDPLTRPYKTGYIVMNTLGGTGWQSGGSTAAWNFRVQQSGLYKLTFRVKQNYREGLPSYRRIAIDGVVPFRELESYAFYDMDNWRTETLSDGAENYQIYLTAGEHTLSVTTVQGEMGLVHDILTADSLALSELALKIAMITGQNPDLNFDYELDKNVPDLMDTLASVKENMRSMMEALERAAGKRPSMYYQLESMIAQIERMIRDPFSIPRRLNDLDSIMTTYGTWLSSFQAHPLLVDYIEWIPADAQADNPQSGFFENLWVSLVNFVQSFFKDYDSITSTVTENGVSATNLDVWIGRGKDWGTLIKQMADESFTPKTGIGVRVNILPAGQMNAGSVNAMLLAIASGKAPDIGLGIPTASIGEFALRNSAAALNGFEGFFDICNQFYEALLIPHTYQGQVFGLPETMNFRVMIYRKDILSNLKLSLPSTWEELYTRVIPVLNQNNMKFYLPAASQAEVEASYGMFLYQAGGSFYNEEQRSALDTPSAYQAFKEMSDLFTMYGVPVVANFYNRFRNGEMPLGIVDYGMYMQIAAAAPELKGRVGISVIPGREQEGGIRRTHTGILGESVMLFSQCHQREEAWEFIKWWLDTETQTEYANEIEALLGEAARWNTANREAFASLSWPGDDLQAILDSYKQIEQVPVILGGYFTARHINNAFNRTVISKQNPRDSLETAVKDINRELDRRRASAGLSE